MKQRVWMAVLAMTAGTSCVSRTQAVRTQPTPAAPPETAFSRQIRNAHDAGEGDYALRQARQKVAVEPANAGARVELAKLYLERGYPDVALEICRLAAARFPESDEVQLALVRSLYALNQDAEAIAGLEAFVSAHPPQAPEYYSWLGLLYDRTGRWGEGEAWHRKAAAMGPAVDYLHNNLGYNLLMQKKNSDAAAEFHEALLLNPSSEMARNNLGLALAHEDQGAQAVANWRTGSDQATAHNNLAAVLIEQGNYVAARKELEVALSYNKSHPAALKNMELLSRLDGKAATLPSNKTSASLWERCKTGFIHLWVGPLDSQAEPARTGSPH